MWLLICLGLVSTLQLPFTVSPSTTVPIVSMQFATVSGYGFSISSERLSLSCYDATYTSREGGELLEVGGGWVSQKKIDLWKADYSLYKKGDLAFGVGVNKTSSDKLGWQAYAEKNFHNIVFVRLGFRRVYMEEPMDALVTSFRVNVREAIESFRKQKNEPGGFRGLNGGVL